MCSLYSLDGGASQIRHMAVVFLLHGLCTMLLNHCFAAFLFAIITCLITGDGGKLWCTHHGLVLSDKHCGTFMQQLDCHSSEVNQPTLVV